MRLILFPSKKRIIIIIGKNHYRQVQQFIMESIEWIHHRKEKAREFLKKFKRETLPSKNFVVFFFFFFFFFFFSFSFSFSFSFFFSHSFLILFPLLFLSFFLFSLPLPRKILPSQKTNHNTHTPFHLANSSQKWKKKNKSPTLFRSQKRDTTGHSFSLFLVLSLHVFSFPSLSSCFFFF